MKVIFINPSWDGLISKKGKRFNAKWPPLCLLNCAGLIKNKGLQIEILDARATTIEESELVRKTAGADKVFITSSPRDRWQCPNLELETFIKVVRPLRKDNLFIMGVHGTLFPEMMLRESGACAVIRGEPEMTVFELCEGRDTSEINGISYMKGPEVVHNPERPLLDINELQVPAYDFIDIRNYNYELLGDHLALLETTRGCPFSCLYCLKDMFGGKAFRKKSAEKVAGEIDCIVRQAGAKSLYFYDLEFTADRNLVVELCNHMIKNRYNIPWCCQTRADSVDAALLALMKRAGCTLIHFGVETGSEKIMQVINKKISLSSIEKGIRLTQKAGIGTACFFMFGFPGETLRDMEETIRFSLKLNPSYASFHIATPYPGTAFYDLANTTVTGPFPEAYTKEHPLEVLEGIVSKALKRFYLRPSYVLSQIRRGNPNLWKKQLRLFLEFLK